MCGADLESETDTLPHQQHQHLSLASNNGGDVGNDVVASVGYIKGSRRPCNAIVESTYSNIFEIEVDPVAESIPLEFVDGYYV
jgi:hypothetical protein